MQIAILTFDGFNEIDSFVALTLLNRLRDRGWSAQITAPGATVTSMNGVTVQAQQPLAFAAEADAVIVGSGRGTLAVVEDAALMARLRLDPARQLLGAQCSGTLILARLGLLGDMPACTDNITRPYLEAAGARVVARTFSARGPVATVGGCLAAPCLAAWLLLHRATRQDAEAALGSVAPVGEREDFVQRTLALVAPSVSGTSAA